MSNFKPVTALALAAFMLVACNGKEEASAPSTTDQVATATTASTTPDTTAAPTTNALTTTVPPTTAAPATTSVSPTTSGIADEPVTEAGVLAAFDDYAELRRTCTRNYASCDESTFGGRISGRLLAYELFEANLFAETGVQLALFPIASVRSFDAEDGSALLDVCDWVTEDVEDSLAGPMSAVDATYEDGRWVFIDMTLLDGENPAC